MLFASTQDDLEDALRLAEESAQRYNESLADERERYEALRANDPTAPPPPDRHVVIDASPASDGVAAFTRRLVALAQAEALTLTGDSEGARARVGQLLWPQAPDLTPPR